MEDDKLNDDLVEWLSQKKSEWLGELIVNQPQDDLNFDQLHHYEGELDGIDQDFDESFEWKEDKIPLTTYLKFLQGKRLTIIVAICLKGESHSLPVFFFATYYRSVADLFCKGTYFTPTRQ